MAPNRITRGGATLAALLCALLVLGLVGCGGGGSNSSSTATTAIHHRESPEGAADGEVLNKILGRQEAAASAFAKVAPALGPRLRGMADYFRGQEEEHVDAVLKAMRGLQVPAESSPEPIEPEAPLKTDPERLRFLYEVESVTIDQELSAISNLEASYPRSLLASTVANQAQHLTLLRQALGEGPLASVPVPFENGTAEPPG